MDGSKGIGDWFGFEFGFWFGFDLAVRSLRYLARNFVPSLGCLLSFTRQSQCDLVVQSVCNVAAKLESMDLSHFFSWSIVAEVVYIYRARFELYYTAST